MTIDIKAWRELGIIPFANCDPFVILWAGSFGENLVRCITTIFLGLFLVYGCSSSFDNSIDADVVLKCESIVRKSESGNKLMLKPLKTIKGEITPDMLNRDGLIDYFQNHETNVTVPKYYKVYLKKTNDRNGIYKNAPLQLIYNITVVADK